MLKPNLHLRTSQLIAAQFVLERLGLLGEDKPLLEEGDFDLLLGNIKSVHARTLTKVQLIIRHRVTPIYERLKVEFPNIVSTKYAHR